MARMNTTQKVLDLLIKLDRPTDKASIAADLDQSVHTVAKSLADLNRGGFIKESKGSYVITPRGKQAKGLDPYLTQFSMSAPKNGGVNSLTFTPDWNHIKHNTLCRQVLDNAEELREYKELAHLLLPIVLVYLIAEGYSFPIFHEPIIPSKKDDVMGYTLDKFMKQIGNIYDDSYEETEDGYRIYE